MIPAYIEGKLKGILAAKILPKLQRLTLGSCIIHHRTLTLVPKSSSLAVRLGRQRQHIRPLPRTPSAAKHTPGTGWLAIGAAKHCGDVWA